MDPLHRPLLIAIAASLISASALAADPAAAPAIDCKALTSRPGAPMTFEQCQAQIAGHADLMQAMNQPGGERPGDEALSCEQITVELRQVSVAGVSRENRIESAAAGKQLQDAHNAQIAKAGALAAAQTTRSAGAAGVDLVTGTNVAGGAATAQNAAEAAALQRQAQAEMGAARDRANRANANARADLATALRANPRMARLIDLAGRKNCSVQ